MTDEEIRVEFQKYKDFYDNHDLLHDMSRHYKPPHSMFAYIEYMELLRNRLVSDY